MARAADTTGLQKLADQGKIKPDTLVALVGKTEGTGFHDDWGRGWADVVLREWTGKFLDIPAGDVAKQVIFVLSGGCPGVITPHIAAVTREWVEVPDRDTKKGGEKRLVVGRGLGVVDVGWHRAPQLGPVLGGGDDLVRWRKAAWRGGRLRQLPHLEKRAADRPFRDQRLHRRGRGEERPPRRRAPLQRAAIRSGPFTPGSCFRQVGHTGHRPDPRAENHPPR